MIPFRVENDRLRQILRILRDVSAEIDTVFSLSLVNRVNEEGTTFAPSVAIEEGFPLRAHAKTNFGLGRRLEEVK